MLALAVSIRLSRLVGDVDMKTEVGACKYGVSFGRLGVGAADAATDVVVRGVDGAVSVGAETGVLCLEADRPSRACREAFAPFFVLGMVEVEVVVWYPQSFIG